jgi:hypothetical protein
MFVRFVIPDVELSKFSFTYYCFATSQRVCWLNWSVSTRKFLPGYLSSVVMVVLLALA